MSGPSENTAVGDFARPEKTLAAAGSAPLVSIVVRTRDRRPQLLRALGSAAAQTYAPVQVVVVNDGGGELDEGALREAAGSAALTYVRLKVGRGRAGAGNAGIEASTGELIAFLDDDDELLPRHLEVLVGAWRPSGAAVTYSDCEVVDRDLDRDGTIVRESSRGRFPMSRDFSLADLCFENYIPLICVLARRDLLVAAAGFDESLDLFEDWDLLLRLASRTPFLHVPEITARYIQWSGLDQVAFSGGPHARDAYLRVLAKHGASATPENLHAFVSTVHGDRTSLGRRIADLDARVREIETSLAEAERRLLTADEEARDAKRVRERANDEIAHLRSRLGEANRTLQSIADSRAWKLLNVYRTGVKERLLPAGSRRRALYNRLLRTGELRQAAGQPSAAPLEQALARQVIRERFLPPLTVDVAAEPLDVCVSIVIPTLDAGGLFRSVLERIGAQQGVREIEVIAVDSGSTDGTLALCAKHGVRVVPYPAEPFNHGKARNIGADAARGAYLVFMSQDVTPVGPHAIAGMVRPLHADPRLAAVSARQVPRSDADLFTCWQLWCYHTKVLAYHGDTTVAVDANSLSTLPPHERRRAAQIDNVFACVRRDAFDRLRFRPIAIAEDLDLGLRLLEHGYSIGFLSSVAAIHSHVRPAAYHLRRSFMETRVLGGLLGLPCLDWSGYRPLSVAQAAGAAARLYDTVKGIAGASVEAQKPAEYLDAVRARLARGDDLHGGAGNVSLDEVLEELRNAGGNDTDSRAGETAGPLRRVLLEMLGSLREYVACIGVLDGKEEDLHTALFKLCGETIGYGLADFGTWAERQGADPAGLPEITAALSRGV